MINNNDQTNNRQEIKELQEELLSVLIQIRISLEEEMEVQITLM